MGLMLLILQQDYPPVVQQGEAPVQTPDDAPRKAEPSWPQKAMEVITAQVEEVTAPPKREAQVPQGGRVEQMACDREAAMAVRNKARTLASISERGDSVHLRMGEEWVYYAPGHRRGFVEAFAEADRCLQGHWRAIRFSYQGETVATVSPDGAIEIK
jgi:hypothetical protein